MLTNECIILQIYDFAATFVRALESFKQFKLALI